MVMRSSVMVSNQLNLPRTVAAARTHPENVLKLAPSRERRLPHTHKAVMNSAVYIPMSNQRIPHSNVTLPQGLN